MDKEQNVFGALSDWSTEDGTRFYIYCLDQNTILGFVVIKAISDIQPCIMSGLLQ